MKTWLRLFLIVFLLIVPAQILFLSSTVMAQPADDEDEDEDDGGGGGGSCDFGALKRSLNETESSGRGCDFSGMGDGGRWGMAIGKYQFIKDTWDRMIQGCPNASECPHGRAIFENPNCCATQECAMDNLLASNLSHIRNNANCQAIMGTTISSPRYGSCTVTLSGVLAAYHLGGTDACDGPARGEYGDSDGHTTEADYICRHGGLPVPEDCDRIPPPPGDGDTDVEPPIGTIDQIRIRRRQGDLVIIGPPNPLLDWWVPALQLMAEQFTVSMVTQVESIGMLLDAKHQLETQRLLQQKMAEAHKDYQPSDQVCTFGTFVRDLVATERTTEVTKLAIVHDIMQRDAGSGENIGWTEITDSKSRISHFRQRFCDTSNNGNGMEFACDASGPATMRNADINYTQMLDGPMTLNINLDDGDTSEHEEILFALVDNLFAHKVTERINLRNMEMDKYKYHYMNMRSIIAMRGIARNSIANIIAMKTQTPIETDGSSSPYMKSLLVELGLGEPEAQLYFTSNPSYYAQMEMLTKKIYQNANFYTALYDKPSNVKRMRAAMSAIKLMQDRDIHNALLRREMLLSIMLELRLRERADTVYNATERALTDGAR